jgi:membrane protease YdiL (CAAX protease family)
VFTNLWEEVAWAGFVQSRLTARHGLVLGAVITGPLFAAQHLPIVVAGGGGIASMLVLGLALAVLSIFFRYVIGATFVETGWSLLIVGILHASSDAAGSAFGTGWQQMIGTACLALLVLGYRAIRRRSGTAQPAAIEPTPAAP